MIVLFSCPMNGHTVDFQRVQPRSQHHSYLIKRDVEHTMLLYEATNHFTSFFKNPRPSGTATLRAIITKPISTKSRIAASRCKRYWVNFHINAIDFILSSRPNLPTCPYTLYSLACWAHSRGSKVHSECARWRSKQLCEQVESAQKQHHQHAVAAELRLRAVSLASLYCFFLLVFLFKLGT